jgi:hypothetical protein
MLLSELQIIQSTNTDLKINGPLINPALVVIDLTAYMDILEIPYTPKTQHQ